MGVPSHDLATAAEDGAGADGGGPPGEAPEDGDTSEGDTDGEGGVLAGRREELPPAVIAVVASRDGCDSSFLHAKASCWKSSPPRPHMRHITKTSGSHQKFHPVEQILLVSSGGPCSGAAKLCRAPWDGGMACCKAIEISQIWAIMGERFGRSIWQARLARR